ncbi:MAG: bifunctional adenosylcobinamide kinase/adenosylcobinamide-phosphate guanylyltransferase [Thiotrichales bacterium]|jgi:adenosylcobinamide kinase/adenosylcobinamide-phosphate guanylyltransferase|nr:bifunctional adenosylcobinamide kinase/adenosylcobinamide-phosphate guanylyltransferase [Thiotrichales bacterium]MBT3614113.1 bifunctional adenosylcobinamide kinase/adenosylcobinamide-phosphate guanylyltransferase [Thiotrichales bacterium]MBT3752798.1 bifunctional adenosylcobinamide kinase/adenosylcobinamide-phosphate guanylyltransferase [Thiotrichales bacterium]MBT3838160.1 bifunctional adenosylcobinamide kinase/adenosylcobinamide-phosphate guanylyltransferase [Thiotrichales bacterium]MBT41
MFELILGGVRSGKSRYAESRALQFAADEEGELLYIATATAGDDEMERRIVKHQQQRKDTTKNSALEWDLIEEPLYLAKVLQREARAERTILVECMTLWLTNLLMAEDEDLLQQEVERLLKTLLNLEGNIIMVSNETGLGVVPMDLLSRKFCDESGRLHQQLAQLSNRAVMVIAGLPQVLKS